MRGKGLTIKTLALTAACMALFGGLFSLARSDRFNEYVGTIFAERFFSDQFALGKILRVAEEEVSNFGTTYPIQTIHTRFMTGPHQGEETVLRNEGAVATSFNRGLHPGEIIIIGTNLDYEGDPHYMSDRFRLPAIIVLALAFVASIILVARWRGLTSLLGLGVTAFVLLGFIIPRILEGSHALWTILAGTFITATVSLYLAHGVNRQTSVAVTGTLITLALSMGISMLCVYLTNVAGIASEDVFYLKLGLADLNVTGLLLGSILIGALGVLDDVTIGQAATVAQIHRADPSLPREELFSRGMAVGREHIASLVNTLVLAYAGTSFPLLLLFIMNQGVTPFWSLWNGEVLGEEIVRTVAGSLTLVLAVPITTFLAASYYTRPRGKTKGGSP